MNQIEVIGLSGKASSGKDFMGKMVLRRAGYHQWALAWPLKTLLYGRWNARGGDHGPSYYQIFHQKSPEVRTALQVIGTEQGRDVYGPEYWTSQARAWLQTLHENLGISKFYFTDVRFPNEVDFIRSFGGKVVRLTHGDRLYSLQDTAAAQHSSETALDDYTKWDLVFENNLSMTPYHFRLALEEAGILPRWSDALEGGNADRMDDRFGDFFNQIPATRAAPCYDVPPIPVGTDPWPIDG